MGNVKNQGNYECPSCSGTEYYSSKETTGAYAVTLNNPGPMDTTSIHSLKRTFIRCSNCQNQMKWIPSAAALKAKKQSYQGYVAFSGLFFGTTLPLAFFAIIGYGLFELGPSNASALLGSVWLWVLAVFILILSLGLWAAGYQSMKLYKAGSKKK